MNSALLRTDALKKHYQMGRTRLDVLRGCELNVREGEFITIMGKSGSGKSTLLHILGALDVPTSGEVYFNGAAVCRPDTAIASLGAWLDGIVAWFQRLIMFVLLWILLPGFALFMLAAVFFIETISAHLFTILGVITAALALLPLYVGLLLCRLLLADFVGHRRIALRRRAFGFVFQFYHLLPELNVLENVLLPRMTKKWPWTWLWERRAARIDALAILKRVGLGGRLKHHPGELSGGERQRVAIARALVHRPRVLLADEPTGNLDAEAGRGIMDVLSGLHAEGQTIVMVTHDPALAKYTDRVLHLENGRLREVRADADTA